MSTSTSTTPPPGPMAPAEVVEAARQMVSELTQQLWAAKRPEDLVATVQSIEAIKSTLEAIELSVVDQMEASNAAAVDGWGSTRDFVTAVSGARVGHGPAQVRLAQGLCTDYRATHAALAEGRLSREQARVIVRTLDRLPIKPALRADGEQTMIELAEKVCLADLETLGDELLQRLDPKGHAKREEQALKRQERAAHLGRCLSIIEDGIGGVRVKGRGTVEDAAAIKSALLPLTKPNPACPDAGATGPGPGAGSGAGCGGNGRDPRDFSTRLWDALVEASHRLLDAEVLPECHGAKPRISITVGYQDLLDAVGTATLETGESLSGAAVRKLACDADLFPIVLGAAGEVLDVGRVQRLVTPAIWKALVARDGHCRFPGCKKPPIACDAHHIKHWLDGGATSLINLVLLCRAHHTMIHQTPWQVRLNPYDLQPEFVPPSWMDPQGRPVRHRKARGKAPPRE